MDAVLDRLAAELGSALGGLSLAQMQAAPSDQSEKWSIQQIAEHLALTYQSSGRVLQERLDKGRPTKSSPTVRQSLMRFLVITIGYFPGGREAPTGVTPARLASIRSGDEMALRLKTELLNLGELTAAGEKMFGQQRAATHQVLGPLSMAEWRKFHLVHGLHHLKQIRAILRGGAASRVGQP